MGKKSKKILYKKGISLIILLITIIVALILIMTSVVATQNAIDNANITTFAKNLIDVQNATENYYVINNVMPILGSSTVMSKDDVVIITDPQNLFVDELTENGDMNSEFYIIDLAKINITKTTYGNQKLGDNDIFVIAYPTMNVYYPYGLEVKNTKYFSITSKLSSVIKIPQDQVNDPEISVISSDGIKVTKSNNWANKMGVSIQVDMAANESLSMSVSDSDEHAITTTTGINTFGFNLLSSIVNNIETIKVPTLTMVEANYIEEGIKPIAERYVDIIKYRDGAIAGKVRIDLSNFSKVFPTITSTTLSSYADMNKAILALAASDSGISEVRYEYLKKYTETGTEADYYTGISDFDSVYMTDKGKRAKVENNLTTVISAPKNVKSIKVAIKDKAGNINLSNIEIAPKVYIGCVINKSTTRVLKLTANMYSQNGIKSVTFSRSSDGITYTDDQTYMLNTTVDGVTSMQCAPFKNSIAKIVYVKIVAANSNNTIVETRIVKVNLTDPEEFMTANATYYDEPATYSNPIIPEGFKPVNTATASWNTLSTDWNNGLVIEDVSGNQFVWVPVDGTNVAYAKWCTNVIPYSSTSDDTVPSGFSTTSITTTYKGFYIARYESMFDYNYGSIRVASKKSANKATSNWSTTRNATYDGYLWNFVNYADSKTYAENMDTSYGYNTSVMGTNLITGAQWDTVMKWLQNSGKDVSTNSTTWGNCSNSSGSAAVTGYGSLQISGFSEYWKAKNIYDLAGNTFELTSEICSSYYIGRGGGYVFNGSTYPAASRITLDDATCCSYDFIGFRVGLYII